LIDVRERTFFLVLVLLLEIPEDMVKILSARRSKGIIKLNLLFLDESDGTNPMHPGHVDWKENLIKVENIFAGNLFGPSLHISIFKCPAMYCRAVSKSV